MRTLGVIGAALLGFACAQPEAGPVMTIESTHAASPRVRLDVLLIIDDSPSMHAHQQALAANLDAFGQLFDSARGVADVRVGVTTTSVPGSTCTGPYARGGTLLTDTCSSLPAAAFVGPGELESGTIDHDALRQSVCDLATIERRLSPIDESVVGLTARPWFEGPSNSYGGNLPEGLTLRDVLPDLALRGFAGCEFESPLAAAVAAVERMQDENSPEYGFWRADAALLLVIITDEDDCSHPESSATIFDPAGDRVFWSDPNASAPMSAICHAASTQCDAQGCTIIDRDETGAPTSDPSAAVLDPIAIYHERFEAELMNGTVGALLIGGTNEYGTLVWPSADPMDATDVAWRQEFGWSPGCIAPDGRRAQPPGRFFAVAEGLPTFTAIPASICSEDWTHPLGGLGTDESIEPWCAPIEVAPTAACELFVRTPSDESPLLACEGEDWAIPEGAQRCVARLTAAELSAECSDQGSAIEWRIVVSPEALPLPHGSDYVARCPGPP